MLQDSPTTSDAEARRRIETSLDESLLVEAAAGTGKTTQLVRRLVAVLQQGRTTVDRIVAVTFTRKAAGELKLRLRQELDRARSASPNEDERRHLEHALGHLEEAQIGTIHSFCADILRQRPVEAGIDPAFAELDEEEGGRLYDRAFQRWIETRLEEMPPGLERALNRLAGERARDRSTPLDRLRVAGRGLVDWRDFPAPWRQETFDRAAAIDTLIEQVTEVAELAERCRNRWDYLRRALEPVVMLRRSIRRAEELSPRDHGALEAQLIQLLRDLRRHLGWKGRGKWFAEGMLRDEALAARERLLSALDDFKIEADAELAAHLHHELSQAVEGYEQLKRRAGCLDFLDLLIRARDLMRGRPDVRRALQDRYTHLFVDEFQDTDPLQAEMLLLLAAADATVDDWRRARPAAGKLFLVGDPKQSIYRFRRADVLLYQEIKERLVASGVGLVQLTRSFRAVRPLQKVVNAAFADEMSGDRDSGQPDYVPLDEERQPHPDQPTIIALPTPFPYSNYNITRWAIEESLPEAVAAWVHWLIEKSGWTIEDPENRGQRLAIAPRHVALLFRRFLSWGDDVTSAYVRQLEARGIPHLLVGGRSFYQREEVETLRAALTAVEWPDDELSVFATLKGQLFAIPDALLLRFRAEVMARLHPFGPRPDEVSVDFLPILQGLNLLADLHRWRNRVPIVETVHRLLAATRAHAGFALRPAGHQVLANVDRICELARRFEVRGGHSFRGFVERLAAEAERPGSTHAPVLEEGADGVRLLTAHAAKGLEFPIVVLADITAKLAREEPGSYLDVDKGLYAQRLLGCAPRELLDHQELEAARDRAEGIRLAYVAATRSRDLLVVPTVGDEPWEDGWVSPLNKAIYPARENYRQSRPAPGLSEPGETSVLRRPQRFDGEVEASVRPGLHRPQLGEHEVLWWDPAALALDVPGNFGLTSEHVLSPGDAAAANASLDRYEIWSDERRADLERGAQPQLTVQPVTRMEEGPELYRADISIESLPRAASRPAGKRFGTLVHTLLRDVGFVADTEQVERLAALHGRVIDADPAEVRAAVDSVVGVLAHPLLSRAAAAERQHRESPFVLRLDDGALVEGTIDLAFLEDDEWTVVDFKTDADLAGVSDSYQRQLSWYVFAMERLTGQKACGVLLGI